MPGARFMFRGAARGMPVRVTETEETTMRIASRHTALAVGSVMEIWPAGSYGDYMPRGSIQQRIGRHWRATGKYIKDAVKRHEREQQPPQ